MVKQVPGVCGCVLVDNKEGLQWQNVGRFCRLWRPRCCLCRDNATDQWYQHLAWCRCICSSCDVFLQLHRRSLRKIWWVYQSNIYISV